MKTYEDWKVKLELEDLFMNTPFDLKKALVNLYNRVEIESQFCRLKDVSKCTDSTANGADSFS